MTFNLKSDKKGGDRKASAGVKENAMEMGMSQSLGMRQQQSMALELRQEMECKLQMAIWIKQTIRMSMEMHKERERTLAALYKDALEKGRVRQYHKHGLSFEFALVRHSDVPKQVTQECGWAFSHCLFNGFEALIGGRQFALSRGSWLLFVVSDMYPNMPDGFLGYAAVHERGEQVTLGNHTLASRLEFGVAAKESRLMEYLNWIEENAPNKFADVFSYQVRLQLPESDDFQKTLEVMAASDEATQIRKMIESFEWPFKLLQKLNIYLRKSEEALEIVTHAMRAAEILAGETALTIKEIISRIKEEIARALRMILGQNLKRHISFPKLNDLWRHLLLEVVKKFQETLAAKQNYPNYMEQLKDAGLPSGLPTEGVLSLNPQEAFAAL